MNFGRDLVASHANYAKQASRNIRGFQNRLLRVLDDATFLRQNNYPRFIPTVDEVCRLNTWVREGYKIHQSLSKLPIVPRVDKPEAVFLDELIILFAFAETVMGPYTPEVRVTLLQIILALVKNELKEDQPLYSKKTIQDRSRKFMRALTLTHRAPKRELITAIECRHLYRRTELADYLAKIQDLK